MGQEQPDSGEIVTGQTVVPMYSEQSREGLSDDKTVHNAPLHHHHGLPQKGSALTTRWLLARQGRCCRQVETGRLFVKAGSLLAIVSALLSRFDARVALRFSSGA